MYTCVFIYTKKNLPTQFTETEQISTVYTLRKTLRSKAFNHKEFIDIIY